MNLVLTICSFREDFQHEVELLVKLRHPNIVQFLGAVTVKKPLMLITEYLQLVSKNRTKCLLKNFFDRFLGCFIYKPLW